MAVADGFGGQEVHAQVMHDCVKHEEFWAELKIGHDSLGLLIAAC